MACVWAFLTRHEYVLPQQEKVCVSPSRDLIANNFAYETFRYRSTGRPTDQFAINAHTHTHSARIKWLIKLIITREMYIEI